jgi:hypothetical protein
MAVGYFMSSGDVHWLEHLADYRTNKWLKRPTAVEPMTSLPLLLSYPRDIPDPNFHQYGLCLQLSTGQIYIFRNTISQRQAIKFYFSALTSRLTGGAFAPGLKRAQVLPSKTF